MHIYQTVRFRRISTSRVPEDTHVAETLRSTDRCKLDSIADRRRVSPRPGPAVETRTTQHGLARRHTESEAACELYLWYRMLEHCK